MQKLIASVLLLSVCVAHVAAETPNIVFIYADDLGYGDVGCYNPESKVSTPKLDRLAVEGMRFTDAHSPSTVYFERADIAKELKSLLEQAKENGRSR